MKKQIKVLCLFDYAANTGFGTVSKNLMKHLKRHYRGRIKWDICAINYFGEPYDEDEDVFVFSAIKSAPKKDDFGRFGFLKILKESGEYDAVLIMQDLGVVQPIIEQLKWIKEQHREKGIRQFKSMFYFPVDCALIPQLLKGMEFFDTLITYTEYGRGQVLKIRPELRGKLKVIPHGNNSNEFRWITGEGRWGFREQYFGENAGKFIITNINRNQPRKDIPTTIFAFIEAKKIWPETAPAPFLYLHMNPNDPMGWDIRAILMQTDLVEGQDYMLPAKEIENHGATTELLNNIYNASNVFLTTTLGEGWGLSVTEAMAAGVPVIAPYNTSLMEIGGYDSERVWHLRTQLPCVNQIDNVIREQCDFNEVADTLKMLYGIYDSTEVLQKMEKAALYVRDLDWEYVSRKWIDYIDSCFF